MHANPVSIIIEDYEYVRRGSITAFMRYAPLEGWREIYVGPTGQRTALDYAEVLRILAEDIYPGAEKIVLLQDNLDIHPRHRSTRPSPRKKARELVQRFVTYYNTGHKHRSLNFVTPAQKHSDQDTDLPKKCK